MITFRSLLAWCLAVMASHALSAQEEHAVRMEGGEIVAASVPSFDCSKAQGFVETTICSDKRLGHPDESISWMYQRLLLHTAAGGQEAIRQEQRNWLQKRNACSDYSCLEATLSARETAVRTALDRVDRALRAHLQQPGQCETTRIDFIGTRLGLIEGQEPNDLSGITVGFADGVWQVDYDRDPQVVRSRVGDPARVCLASIPRHCPKGDERGRTYSVENLRTHVRWKMPDAAHDCGGA